jgi:hypothetical protein
VERGNDTRIDGKNDRGRVRFTVAHAKRTDPRLHLFFYSLQSTVVAIIVPAESAGRNGCVQRTRVKGRAECLLGVAAMGYDITTSRDLFYFHVAAV